MNKVKHFHLLGICLVFLCASFAQGQRKVLETDIKVVRPEAPGLQNDIKVVRPNLVGTWKLNFLKSGFVHATEKELAENSLLVVIGQQGEEVTISVRARRKTEEEVLEDFILYTDGRVSEISGGFTSRKAIAEWTDSKLRISSFSESQGRRTILEVFEFAMSADGKTLTGMPKITSGSADGKKIRSVDEIISPRLVLDRISSPPQV
jgi:hypothetical protein